MKKFVALVAMAAAGLCLAPRAQAQEDKNIVLQGGGGPAVVFALPSIDRLVKNIEFFSEAAGQKEAAGMAKFAIAAFTRGVDKTKPMGGFVTFGEDMQPQAILFAPVADLPGMLAQIKDSVGPSEDAGNGVFRVTPKGGQPPMFVKASGGWAFVGQDPAHLDKLPADPVASLAGLDKKYEIGVRVNTRAIPEFMRNMAVDEMKKGLEQGLQNPNADATPEERALAERLSKRSMEQMKAYIEESENVVLGLGVDAATGVTFLDMSIQAVAGTGLANTFAAIEPGASNFAGFETTGNAASMCFRGKLSAEDIEQLELMVSTMRKKALDEIERDANLKSAEERAVAKEVLSSLMDAISATVKSGQLDGGVCVSADKDSLVFAGGGQVADGREFEKIVKRVVEVGKSDPQFPKVQLDAETVGDVKLHVLTAPIPEPDARKLFGDELQIVVGMGAKSVYFSLGRDALKHLRDSIEASTAAAQQPAAPAKIVLRATPLLKLASSFVDNADLNTMIESAAKAGGKDRIVITTTPIERGSTTRVELDRGVIELLGKGAALLPAGGAPPVFDDPGL